MRLAALIALTFASPLAALDLTVPLDCDFDTTCYIQQFTDRDPGPGVRDALCGDLANDGHKGTDFALPDRALLQSGVTVIAAASGTVKATRDGMPDIPADAPDAPGYEGRDCGNGLVIDHGDGWETQYCHLRQGSVRVRQGQSVEAGAPLGLVGLSGATTFPHLHFSLRRDGAVVDPLVPGDTCGDTSETLFTDPPPIRPAGLIATGFASGVPAYDAIKAGTAATDAMPRTAPGLVIWGHAFGVRPGDEMRLAITGPEGEVIDDSVTFDRAQATAFRAIGRRTPPQGWVAGPYEGTLTLTRGDRVLDSRRTTVTLD